MMDDIDRSFEWWKMALQGQRGPIDADNPKAGFYRSKRKDKSLHAVAIWYDSNSGDLRYQEDGRDVDEMRARERWPHDSRRPISEEVFWHFRDTGIWKDVDEAAQTAIAETSTDPAIVLKTDIAAAKEAATKYAKVESDEEMALAQSLRTRLQELAGKADKIRVAEKEPHFEAGREVDAKWQPLVKDAKGAADAIRTAMAKWNDFKLAQAAKAQTSDNAVSNAPPPSVQVSGGGGRAAAVTVKDTVVAIDEDKVFQQFKGNADLTDILMRLAQRAIDAGTAVPGATIEKRSGIR